MTVYRFLSHNLFIAVCSVFLGTASFNHAHAQPSGARGTDFIYRVVQHDTLLDIAQRYTHGSENWQRLQQLNKVADPYQLSIGRSLRIPFDLIPELPSRAMVTHLAGIATVNGKPLALGNEVIEGDLLAASPNGYITLTLEDNSVSSVSASSTVRINRLRTFQGTGLLDAIFSMEKGSLESIVSPQDKGVGRFEIRTPVSITGVRGTRLRVRADHHGMQTEVLEGSAQLGAGAMTDPAIAQGQGAATTADGQFLGVRSLLPAPTLQPETGPHDRVIQFSPVAGARSYIALVARDPQGTERVYEVTTPESPVTIRTPGPGTYYVFVRAVDAHGVMGTNATRTVLGLAVLTSTDGQPVRSGLNGFVSLTQY